MEKDFSQIVSEASIEKAKTALAGNNIEVVVVANGQEAKGKVEQLIPKAAEVMTMTSETLRLTGIAEMINNSGSYDSVRVKLTAMPKEQEMAKKKLGAAPEWAIGSVHAVTEDGKVLIASQTGSQLPAYVYGAMHVVWVVGAQKIVKDLDEATKRVYEYVLPLEDARAQKAYGSGSHVSKLLMIEKEVAKGRITMIVVKEPLGF